jgi:hypothetical protein
MYSHHDSIYYHNKILPVLMFLIAILSLWSIIQNMDIMDAFQKAKKKEFYILRHNTLIQQVKNQTNISIILSNVDIDTSNSTY